MASIITLTTHSDDNGDLTVVDFFDFNVKRFFYITAVPQNMIRGLHGHIKNRMALIALSGSVDIFYNNGSESNTITLNSKNICLQLEPNDWHRLENFSSDIILLVACSEPYDKNDYFFEEPA